MKRKKLWAVIIVMITTLAFSACSSGGESEKVSKGDKSDFTVALTADLSSLDPSQNNDYNANLVVNNFYDTVLRFSQDGTKVEPWLASSWKQTDDVTYVFQLRNDVSFWNGDPMTADDVVFSLNRHLNPDLASLYGNKLDSVASIDKTGDFEMTITLSKPDSTFINVLATFTGAVVQKAYVEKAGSDFGTVTGGTMGTGPFEYKSWKEGSEILSVKNEKYWNKDVNIAINNLTFTVIPDVTAQAVAMANEQVDFINMPTTDVFDQIKNSGVARVDYNEGLMNGYVSFNSSYGPFSDPNVRKAAAYAIDGKAIAKAVLGEGYYTDSKSLDYDPSVMGYDKQNWETLNDKMEDYSYDLEKAKEYLAKSKYPNGFSCTMPAASINQKASEAIQYYLQQLNITVNIETVTVNDLMTSIYGVSRNEEGFRDYDLIVFSWFPDFPDPVSFLYLYYGPYDSVGGYNMSAYQNDAFDALIEKSKIETGDERSQTLQEAYKMMTDDCPRKVYAYYGTSHAINNKYDLKMSPMWFWNFNFSQINIK